MTNKILIVILVLVSIVIINGCTSQGSITGTSVADQQSEDSLNTQPQSQASCTDDCTTDSCDGMELISCEERSDGCKYEINKGRILGKCNVECIVEGDCVGTDEECKNNKCVKKPVEVGHSRSKPAPIDTPLTTKFGYSWYQEVDAEITLLGIKEGNSAWNMIQDANMFNDEPEQGKEYLLAKISFKLIKTSDDKAYSISSFEFEAVSEDGGVYENPFVVEPEPQLSKDLYPGSSHEGWIAFEIDKDDPKPLMVFDRDEDGELWFKLY